jgi:hypothetical protein
MGAFDALFEKTAAPDDILMNLLRSEQYQKAEDFDREVAEFKNKNRPKFYATVASGTVLGTGGAAGIAKAFGKKPIKPALIALPIAAASSALVGLDSLGRKYTAFEQESKVKYGLE